MSFIRNGESGSKRPPEMAAEGGDRRSSNEAGPEVAVGWAPEPAYGEGLLSTDSAEPPFICESK